MVVIRGKAVTADPMFRALSELFPADVVVAIAEAGDDPQSQYPEEDAAVVRAVPSRRREFRLGRACAHAALGIAGAAPAPLPAGPDRAPRWPLGFVGSITHCDGFIGACVARSDVYEGIGFDAERSLPLAADLVSSVCTPAERSELADLDGKIIFAAKEALHKCVAPASGIMLDFQDVTIRLNAGEQTYRATLEPGAPSLGAVSRVEGRFRTTPELVFAVALAPRRKNGSFV